MATTIISTNTIVQDGAKVMTQSDAGVVYTDSLNLTVPMAIGKDYLLALGSSYSQGQTRLCVQVSVPMQIKLWPTGFVSVQAPGVDPLISMNIAGNSMLDVTLPSMPAALEVINPAGAASAGAVEIFVASI
jgi:hypothetical protein